MNKRIFSIMLSALMVFGISAYAEPEQDTEETKLIAPALDEKTIDIKLTIGEKLMIFEGDIGIPLDVPPTIINDRTMVPLRAIFEALGAVVDWDDETKTVFAINKDKMIVMQIGQDVMYVNEERKELHSPSVIIDGRTLVPVRAIAEAFGNTVDYNEETKTVTITN